MTLELKERLLAVLAVHVEGWMAANEAGSRSWSRDTLHNSKDPTANKVPEVK